MDDHTGHCHQLRAPFSSPPTPSTPRATCARLCVSHSGTVCQLAKTLARTECRARKPCPCQGKQAEPPHSSPDMVQQVQKGENRKINSPKQDQLHLHQLTPAMKQSSSHLHFLLAPRQQRSLLCQGLMEGTMLLLAPENTQFGQDRA